MRSKRSGRLIFLLASAGLVVVMVVGGGRAVRQIRQREADDALITALKHTDAEKVALLLKNGANPNARIRKDDTVRPMWQVLLDRLRGIAPPKDAYYRGTGLLMAQYVQNWPSQTVDAHTVTREIETLLAAGADPNIADDSGKTPLMEAMENDNPDAARLLIEHGANVNVHNDFNDTPLLLASRRSNSALVDLLIAHGADLNAQDDAHYTPLGCAASHSLEITRLLVTHGATTNGRADTEGLTPLGHALETGNTDIGTFLLDHGANPNVMGTDGETLLTYECGFNRRVPLIKKMIAHGADIQRKNRRGRTPLACAIAAGDPDTIAILKAAGATR